MTTFHPIEAAWTAIALVGLAVAVWNLVDAWHDLRAIDRLGVNGALRALAYQQARAESRTVAILVLFAAMGVVAAVTPPPASQTATALSIVVGVGLVLTEITLVLGGIDDRLTRRRLMAKIDAVKAGTRQDAKEVTR